MKEAGTTFFLTTHDMAEAAKLCDRIVLFNEGKIIESGTLEELKLKHTSEKKVNMVLSDRQELELELTPENSSKIADLITRDQVMTIHWQEPTLEDIFLKLTGRGLQ